MSHEIYTSDLFKLRILPGTTAQTFPSGLVRVDRTYVAPTAYSGAYLGADNPLDVGAPLPGSAVRGLSTIGGLRIFPSPQVNIRGDGFTEFRVSAYGRTTTVPHLTTTFEEGEYTHTSTTIVNGTVTSESAVKNRALFQVAIEELVVPDDYDFSPSNFRLSIFNRPLSLDDMQVVNMQGVGLDAYSRTQVSGNTTYQSSAAKSQTFERFDCNSFGKWLEIKLTWKATYVSSSTTTIRTS